MTWEIVTLMSVAMITLCVFLCVGIKYTDWGEDVQQVSSDEFELMKIAVGKIQNDNETIHKLAEETKKLLSQENLAKSMGVRR